MSKHTPGPWKVRGGVVRGSNFGDYHAGVFGTSEPDGLGGRYIPKVAKVVGMNDRDTILANAHLIAAAPDLLEALENLENDDGSIPDHAWQLVQAAIAKARG